MPVKERDEEKADDDPREDRADGKLRVGPVALYVAALRRAEEGRRADLRGEDAREHRPPRRLPVAEREALDAPALRALREPDADDDREVGDQDQRIERRDAADSSTRRAASSRAAGGRHGLDHDLRVARAGVVFPAGAPAAARRASTSTIAALLLEVIKGLRREREDVLRAFLRRELLGEGHQLAPVALALVALVRRRGRRVPPFAAPGKGAGPRSRRGCGRSPAPSNPRGARGCPRACAARVPRCPPTAG